MPARSGSTFAAHPARIAGFGLVILAVTTVVSFFVQAPLGGRPVPGIEASKPRWMFLPFHPFEDWFELRALITVPGILFAALAAVPFLDRSPYRSPSRRKAWIALGALVAASLVALVLCALRTAPKAHVVGAR